MSLAETKCPFCNQGAKFWSILNTHNYFGYDCNTCGAFFLTWGVIEMLKSLRGSQQVLNCVSENISSNTAYGKEIKTSWHLRSEEKFPLIAENITKKYLEDFLDIRIDHANKVGNLLLVLAEKAQKAAPFMAVSLSLKDIYQLKILNFEECFIWLKKLNEMGLLDSSSFRTMGHGFTDDDIEKHQFCLTVDGWQTIHSEQLKRNSKKVFIAMQFNWGDESGNAIRTKYIEAIKSGCAECGFVADVVSQNHTDYITDRIVSEIKSSLFVIADFTFNNQGVYYEAGLARGLGKKVIHTVMKGHTDDKTDKFKQLHFDIKQINYIEWIDPEGLRSRIVDRIRSTIESE